MGKKFKWLLVISLVLVLGRMLLFHKSFNLIGTKQLNTLSDSLWIGKSANQLPQDTSLKSRQIRYGYELVTNTAKYLGPHGQVAQVTNGMNCQNCHLQAGTKPWGLNYGSVAANYPKFRARSGTVESIVKRVNDCLERSLNGRALDSSSLEMNAFVHYIKWIAADIPKDSMVNGSGIEKLPFLDRAADPRIGKILYSNYCSKCHGKSGEGKLDSTGASYFVYPPLWGKNSYNHGAGINQLSKLAGFIKNNMPNGTSYQQPFLTNQESWDLAAYINTQTRPDKDLSKDWPNLATKPFDYPFGPFADSFPALMHQLGPFAPIQQYWQNRNSSK